MALNKLKRIVISLLAGCLLGTSAITASADSSVELSDGSVEGISKGLYVMDEDGNSVSESGEYFVSIDDMQPCVTYTKTLSLQNFVENTYTLTMAAESVSKSGNLDLEENTNVKIYLDGEELYDGLVTGEGNVSMTDGNVLDLGELASGESKEMQIEIYWDGSGFEDIEGDSYEGEVQFKWIFEAAMKEETTETTTTTNTTTTITNGSTTTTTVNANSTSADNESVVNTGSQMFTVAIAVLFLVLLVLAFLAMFSRFKKVNDDDENDEDNEDNGGDDDEQE